ncbi:MAG: hypothetical protein HXY41_10570 [Chloroflexi bacterium]|nr:hypothetical protein [Chloroflexota bacterium]
MQTLRRWQLDSSNPLLLQLAADARLCSTDYADDQSWELSPGSQESPALVLQTRYGGRAGLVSLVPMWDRDGSAIYQAQAYTTPPKVTAFAPGYICLHAALTPQLTLEAEYWVMESHAVGARFTLANTGDEPLTVRLDLFGHVGMSGKEQPVRTLKRPDGSSALALGKIGNLRPVVLLDEAEPSAPETVLPTPKIGRAITVEARKKAALRWVHAGLTSAEDSLALAADWLKRDWDTYFKRIAQAASALPVFETGDADLDATIAFGVQQLVQSIFKPGRALPHPSFVAVRGPARGFSPRGDGSDHDRAWAGQPPTLAYLVSLGMASIAPNVAQGIVRNYLAVQQPDGWIDWKPGLGGQRQGILCLPILARLAWGIFQYTEDTPFLNEVFPGLLRFFDRWFQPDLDADGDGLPEWQNEQQTGYVFFPTFASWQTWGQKADIRMAETPDLLAYLLSEAKSLKEIAYYLHNTSAEKQLEARINSLTAALESLWRDSRYAYRDRDTHRTAGAVQIIHDARGGDDLIPAEVLDPPNRLIVEISGGVNLAPRLTLRLEGADENGQNISETADSAAFLWAHGRGAYTSRRVFSRLDRVSLEGLSRVYRVDVHTMDTSRMDINTLLPLWSVGIPQEKTAALESLLTDPAHFWRANGVTMCSAQDANFDPSNTSGSGGVWPFWLTLIGEGLIEYNRAKLAAQLLKRLLAVQTAVLKEQKAFAEFYHSDEPRGLGERDHVGGLVPLHLLLRIIGVRIISPSKVWTGGPFVWDSPVTISQHGVTVRRGSDRTLVEFPSGHTVEVMNDTWQEIVDSKLA